MDALSLTHLISLCLWGGLVLGEIVLELAPRDAGERRAAARFHHLIDLAVEIPLLAVVVASGVLLAIRAWPLSPLHDLKIAAALIAIGANAVCVGLVVARRRRLDDPAALASYRRRIAVTVAVGLPCGLLAFILGLRYFVH